ncbi:MAG TPA: glycosyltransferase family 4 protein [Candidatus Dormibacteraeota bacterium]|nr:glycosyltransferase family 4 protein [Candidatus Dormibacteraeota bacterium]
MWRLAVICSRYPAVSHSFVVNEVRALRDSGFDVHAVTVRRPREEELLSSADREEDARTFAVLPPSLARFAAAHLRALLSHPLRWLGTLGLSLRLSTGGLRSGVWRLFYFAEALVVWDECRRRGVRHLHAHFANVGSDLALLAAHFGGEEWSWSFTMHGCSELFEDTPHRLPEKIRRAHLVVCNIDFTRAQLMKLVAHEQWERLHTVRCGIDAHRFETPARHASEGPLRVLTVARLVPGKGHALLLEALASLRERGIETATTFVGEGPEREALERLAGELRLDVRLAGVVGQDELRAFYEDAELFCLPTFAEGLGVVLLEAMSAGLPVVSSLVMGVPEVVEDGETGLLVLPGRADLLAEALVRLAESHELRERLGSAGRRWVEDEFGIERASTQLAGLLEERVFGGVSVTQEESGEREPAAAAAA